MARLTKTCEKGMDPATCSLEQVRRCHGQSAEHPCTAVAGRAHDPGVQTEAATSEVSPDVELLRPPVARLFWEFLRLGLTAFGGPAMVAYIGELAVAKKQWLSRSSFKEGVAVAQTIPGATAMQVAAYVGLRARGMAGAAAAFIGFGLPAFVFMLILSFI